MGKIRKLLCLLLILAAACAIMTVAASAAESRASQLATPSIVKMENTADGIQITWGRVSGAAGYRVFVKTSSGWKGLGNTTSNTYTYTAAVSGKTYFFTVRCVDAQGTSFTSGYNAAGWSQTYVAQPAIKTLENRVTGVKLTWDLVPGAERYRIYVKEPGGSWDYVANTMGNTFTYIWVESGKDYIFTIRCANKDNNVFTSSFDTTGWQTTYIGQPKVTNMESLYNGVQLTWNAVPGAARYRVYARVTGGWKYIGSTTGTGYVVPGTKDGVTYSFTVRCVNAENNAFTSSFFESGWQHTYTAVTPPSITRLEAVDGAVKITWGAVSGTERYRVYVKTTSGWKNIGSTAGTTFLYRGVTSGETYTFTVRCIKADGSAFTSGYNADGWSIQYVAVPQISTLESTADGLKLTWAAVPGAGHYRVYVRLNGAWKCVGNTADTTFTYQQAQSGQSYTFTLRCTNEAGDTFTSYIDPTGKTATYVAQPEITGFEAGNGSVTAVWDAVPGAGGYRVYARVGRSWKYVGCTTDTSFTLNGVQSGVTYYFTVRCTNAEGNAFTSSFDPVGWSVTC